MRDNTIIKTPLGNVKVVGNPEYYESGKIKAFIAGDEIVVNLEKQNANVILNYTFDHVRKIYRNSITFYESGSIKSIYAEEPILLKTSLGKVQAEMITFYESGNIKRVYPVYGGINAYWSEKDEYNISPYVKIILKDVGLIIKPMILGFYESGALWYISVWDKTKITIPGVYGCITTDFGIELYEDGSVKSIEPSLMSTVDIDGKEKYAYRFFKQPFHATDNYLKFDMAGNIINADKLVDVIKEQ